MKKTIVYVHGKGGTADESKHYEKPFGCEVIGFDYRSENPWQAKDEFLSFFEKIKEKSDEVVLVANSIGAYFAMNSLSEKQINEAFFISPVVDMERLITDMMTYADVTESKLREKGEIPTSFGETLSWEYLCYVRLNPIKWKVKTHILYGENDNLTSLETIKTFALKVGATLTVMPDGEHWFHTEPQMKFLDEWIKNYR